LSRNDQRRRHPPSSGVRAAWISMVTPSLSLPVRPNAVPGVHAVTLPSSTVERPATFWAIRSLEPTASGPGSRRSTRTIPDAISHSG
jgi:hypothetical protein